MSFLNFSVKDFTDRRTKKQTENFPHFIIQTESISHPQMHRNAFNVKFIYSKEMSAYKYEDAY